MEMFPPRDNRLDDPNHFQSYTELLRRRLTPVRLPHRIDTVLAMDVSAREAHDRARHRYLSSGFTVRNRNIDAVTESLAALMRENASKSVGGYGMLIEEMSGAGKSTAIEHALAQVFASRCDNELNLLDPTTTPVGHVKVPVDGHPRSLYGALADYLGIDHKLKGHEAALGTVVRRAINACRMEVLAIDEVQNLRARTQGDTVADAVRRLADDVGATVVLSGYSQDGLRLTNGRAGAQVANRFDRVDFYDYCDDRQADWELAWRGLVKGMLHALPLHALNPDQEESLLQPLFAKTLGSVLHLQRGLISIARAKIDARDPRRETVFASDVKALRFRHAPDLLLHRARIADRKQTRRKAVTAA